MGLQLAQVDLDQLVILAPLVRLQQSFFELVSFTCDIGSEKIKKMLQYKNSL